MNRDWKHFEWHLKEIKIDLLTPNEMFFMEYFYHEIKIGRVNQFEKCHIHFLSLEIPVSFENHRGYEKK